MKRKKPASQTTEAFEKAIRPSSAEEPYVLRLYVTGMTPKSARAIQNIKALCEERLAGRYKLEVIDIYQHPGEVKAEEIVVTPTLVKKLPLPFRRLIGDLSNKDRVLVGLDLLPRPAKADGAR